MAKKPPLARRIEEFLTHIELSRNLSPRTVRSYRSDLALFDAFVRERWDPGGGVGAAGATLDVLAVRAFVAELHHRGHRKSSTARRLSAIRSFGRWLRQRGFAADNPAARIP